jgi:hypothetical protein
MEISLKTLGSYEIQAQILKDIEDLLKTCQYEGLTPLYISVGSIFLEVNSANKVRSDLQVSDWNYHIEKHFPVLRNMFVEYRLELYKRCAANSGVFDRNEDIVIFFDPDEAYVSLYVANTKKKAKTKSEPQTRSGHPVSKLQYEDEDILVDFNGLKSNQ